MKRLVLSLEPITQQYKGSRAFFTSLSYDVAIYNGGNYGDPDNRTADAFIEELFKGTKYNLVKVNDSTYRFGHTKTGGYVQYGSIIKTIIL